MIRHAIISVHNKSRIRQVSRKLIDHGYRIVSTGGTFRDIKPILHNGEEHCLTQVSDLTGYPELLGGRVKTLHPIVHAGILARKNQEGELRERDIPKIDLVIGNLYPFQETVASGASDSSILEQIDIGGPTLLRAAAKNYPNCVVIVDPADYSKCDTDPVLLGMDTRRELAQRAFSHVAEYDIAIARYFGDRSVRKYYPQLPLKYGCNPYQSTAALCSLNTPALPLKVLNGNVGYINLMDALLGFQLVCEAETALGSPVCASYKHTSPAGVGTGSILSAEERVVFNVPSRDLSLLATSFVRARNCDPVSSFGDFLSFSGTVDKCTAELIRREVSDGIIAPGYTAEALAILSEKKNGSYTILQLPFGTRAREDLEYREIAGMALVQTPNRCTFTADDFKIVTSNGIPDHVMQDLILANITLKYTQSNSVAIATDGQVVGIGAGQQNRVDCVKLAGEKARTWTAKFAPQLVKAAAEMRKNGMRRPEINNQLRTLAVKGDYPQKHLFSLASDAFFPFSDSIAVADSFGVKYISQPGGSIGDDEVTAACDKEGIAMAFTNKRLFLH